MAKKLNANKPALLDLRPTQFVLGIREIEYKVKKMRAMSERELRDYCKDHVIPVVKGPKNQFYMIDHHHFARACWELNIEEYEVEVLKDLSGKSEQDFWNFMIAEKWVYLHDQFGMGPHSPIDLPNDIRCLADDPFRSLVWELINVDSIKKDKVPFFEFQWAAYLRFNLGIPLHSKSNFKEAIT